MDRLMPPENIQFQAAPGGDWIQAEAPPGRTWASQWNNWTSLNCSEYANVTQESTIPGAGRGVVAQQDIPRGTIISFYPVHRIGIYLKLPDDDIDNQVPPTWGNHRPDTEYFESVPDNASVYIRSADFFPFVRKTILGDAVEKQLPDSRVLVDVNPNHPIAGAWMSHLVNDGAKPKSSSVEDFLEYYHSSHSKMNCVDIPWGPCPLIATVTTRDVKQGEELFTYYGMQYWAGKLSKHLQLEREHCMANVTKAGQQLQFWETTYMDWYQDCLKCTWDKYSQEAEALEANSYDGPFLLVPSEKMGLLWDK